MVTIPNANKYVKKLDHLYITGWNVKCHSFSEKHLDTFIKLKCFTIGESLNELWYIYTIEYCSPVKKNELLISLTCVDHRDILVSGQRLHNVWFHYITFLNDKVGI